MKEKKIPDYEDYAVTTDGNIISYKNNKRKVLYKTIHFKNGYENIKLCKNNVTKTFLVHRLVAQAFIPNPDNLPEVNHRDKNRHNNCVSNLEWCTRKQNLYDSYAMMSPIRNFINCSLYNPKGKKIKDFQSITEVCRFASKNFNVSYLSLQKYHILKGYQIIKSVETKK